MNDKLKKLKQLIKEMGSVLVAFSGGLDSTFLLKVAHDELGDRSCAITATSPAYSKREYEEAQNFCSENGIKHVLIESNEMNIPEFKFNAKDRCYHCKKDLFSRCIKEAEKLNIKFVADGHNRDDLTDYRPGSKAAEELGIKRPLLEAGFTKEDIRKYSKELKLSTWGKASYACLASRFPYGTEINKERLRRVEMLENFFRDEGFHQIRVRFQKDTARIEVMPEDFGRILDEAFRKKIIDKSAECGFIYTTLDLKGYRTGSMNEP